MTLRPSRLSTLLSEFSLSCPTPSLLAEMVTPARRCGLGIRRGKWSGGFFLIER